MKTLVTYIKYSRKNTKKEVQQALSETRANKD